MLEGPGTMLLSCTPMLVSTQLDYKRGRCAAKSVPEIPTDLDSGPAAPSACHGRTLQMWRVN